MNCLSGVCVFAVLAYAAAQCQQQGVSYFNCLKQKHEEKRQEFEAKKPQFRACLTSGGCPLPAEGQRGQNNATARTGKSRPHLGNLTDTQKQCLKQKFEEKKNAKLEQCLGHAPPAWVHAAAQEVFQQAKGGRHRGGWGKGKGRRHGGFGNCNKDVVKNCFKTVFNIDKEDRNARKQAKCAAVNECAARITGDCKVQFDELKQKTCTCTSTSQPGAGFSETLAACGINAPANPNPRVEGPAVGKLGGRSHHGKGSFKPPYCKCIDNDNDDDDDEDNDNDDDQDEDEDQDQDE